MDQSEEKVYAYFKLILVKVLYIFKAIQCVVLIDINRKNVILSNNNM